MKITVRINGVFDGRLINENFEIQISNGAALKDLIEKAEKHAKTAIERIVTEERSNPVFLVNDQRIELPEGFSKKLNDGDKVVILQAIGGG